MRATEHMRASDEGSAHGALWSPSGGVITVFQNQVPNSKGRAVIHSEELPPESQANYRPSHRPITARVTDQLPPARRGPRSGQPGSPAIIPDLAD